MARYVYSYLIRNLQRRCHANRQKIVVLLARFGSVLPSYWVDNENRYLFQNFGFSCTNSFSLDFIWFKCFLLLKLLFLSESESEASEWTMMFEPTPTIQEWPKNKLKNRTKQVSDDGTLSFFWYNIPPSYRPVSMND